MHIGWTMRPAASFAAMALAALVGCASPTGAASEEVGETSSAIVGGHASAATEDFVVRLDIGASDFCTGTLITPNLVLTARHCVSTMSTNTACGTFLRTLVPSSIAVSIGVAGNQRVARGSKIYVDAGTTGCSHDVALVELDADVTGAPIATLRFTKVAQGESASTLGYGDNGHGTLTPGRYERSGLVVVGVGPKPQTHTTKSGRNLPYDLPSGELATGESTCFGDSGGPLLDVTGAVIGITSRGIDQVCLDRPTLYSDIASHADLVRTAAEQSGHPLTEATDTPPANPSAAATRTPTPTPSPAKATEEAAAAPAQTKPSATDASANGGCRAAPSGQRYGSLVLALAVACVTRFRRRRGLRSCARSSSR